MKKTVLKKIGASVAASLVALALASPLQVNAAANGSHMVKRLDCVIETACKLADFNPTRNDLPYVRDQQWGDWCARFVSYVVGDLNYMYEPSIANSVNQIKWYYNDRGLLRNTNPKVGDIVFFDWQESSPRAWGSAVPVRGEWDHIGIIVGVDYENGRTYINTVEGNQGGSSCYDSRVQYNHHRNWGWSDNTYIVAYATPYSDKDQFRVREGDCNGDGRVNSTDISFLNEYLNNRNSYDKRQPFWRWSGTYIDKANFLACDVNRDGQIDYKDLGEIQRYVSGR